MEKGKHEKSASPSVTPNQTKNGENEKRQNQVPNSKNPKVPGME